MSSSPTLSGLNAETESWPVLTEVEINRGRPYGRVRQAELGEILYRPGMVGMSCFILLSASLEIVQPSIYGERLIKNFCPGMFTGEAGMIAGQRTVVTIRSHGTRFVRLCPVASDSAVFFISLRTHGGRDR